jgi:hypothetical protein
MDSFHSLSLLIDSSEEAKTVGEPARKSDIRAGKIRWGIGDDTRFQRKRHRYWMLDS